MNQFPATALRLLKGSLLFFPILTILFWVGSPLGLLGAACLALLLELLPAVAVAQLPLAEDDTPLPRIPVYLSSAVIILVLGGLGFLIGWHEFGWEAMGIRSAEWGAFLSWAGSLVVAALLLLLAFLRIRKALGIRESPLLIQLLPEGGSEKAVFVLLSMAAGIGEELAYRGFLTPALTLLFGWSWGAALLSSLAFGLLHAYQGWLGVIRTAALGFVLAGSLILSGILWPAIVAHAILDVLAGIVLGKTLVKE